MNALKQTLRGSWKEGEWTYVEHSFTQDSRMKALKPGQVCMIDDVCYRAKKRTRGCDGCAFTCRTCPNIPVSNEKRPIRVDCFTHWVILERL